MAFVEIWFMLGVVDLNLGKQKQRNWLIIGMKMPKIIGNYLKIYVHLALPKVLPRNSLQTILKQLMILKIIFFQADDDIIYYNERYVRGELEITFQELDAEISLSEIMKGICLSKNGKRSGPDLLLNEFIKYGNENLMQYLYCLFNKSFAIGYFPDSWGDGFIVPLHKKGSTDNVENYRGITLLSIVSKLFSNILNLRLDKWAEKISHIY